MDINQCRTFFEIVNTGSFSEASKKLFITQSAVSHQIKNLEKELNAKLFQRIGNKMKLTIKGELLSSAVATFLDDLKRISEGNADSNAPSLTLSATRGILVDILPNVIMRFRERFPRVKLKLLRGSTPYFLRMVSHGEVDLAIRPKSNQVLPDNVNYLPWKSFARILLVPKSHPLSKKKHITLVHLSAIPLILCRVRMRQTVEKVFSQNKLPYELVMETGTAETAIKYVEMGLGGSIVDSSELTRGDRQKFCSVDVSPLFGKVEYGIYSRKDAQLSQAMKRFISFFAPELFEVFSADLPLPNIASLSK